MRQLGPSCTLFFSYRSFHPIKNDAYPARLLARSMAWKVILRMIQRLTITIVIFSFQLVKSEGTCIDFGQCRPYDYEKKQKNKKRKMSRDTTKVLKIVDSRVGY